MKPHQFAPMQLELEDLQSITETLHLSEKGHELLDPDMLRRAFHDKAIIVGYHNGELTFDGRDDFLQILIDGTDANEHQVENGSGSLRLLWWQRLQA